MRLFEPRKKSPRKRGHLAEEEVLSHSRALDLLSGKQLPLPEARIMCYDVRRPWFSKASLWGECHEDDPADVYYELADIVLNEAALPKYSSKELVIWKE